jgi:hypothetical protein
VSVVLGSGLRARGRRVQTKDARALIRLGKSREDRSLMMI